MEPHITRKDRVFRGTVDEVKHTGDKEDHGNGGNDCELDLLFLVHSDIASVLHQIDELVMKAAKHKTMSKQGKSEVESFRFVLSNMLSSLKPWFPRLQEAISEFQFLTEDQEGQPLMSTSSVRLDKEEEEEEEEELFAVESPEPTQFEPLVSPSPLVSWRGDHAADKGRQLFLLTPLPLGKSEFLKHRNASKLTAKRIVANAAANQSLQISKETTDDVLGGESMKTAGRGNSLGPVMDLSETLVECEPLSSPVVRRKIQSELLMTPCLKMSPPKSCTLFKPVPEISQPGKQEACKSTCSELGASTFNGSQNSGSSANKTDNLCSKYPELLGMQHAPITRKTDLESSPVWWFSPPKTRVLMEPVNEKKPIDETGGSKMVSSFHCPNIQPEANHTKEGSMSMVVVESTPIVKEPESVMSKHRTRAGESTLKKELWTRFEEASMQENRFGSMTTTTMRGNKKKGFMEMLEEASGNEETQELN